LFRPPFIINEAGYCIEWPFNEITLHAITEKHRA